LDATGRPVTGRSERIEPVIVDRVIEHEPTRTPVTSWCRASISIARRRNTHPLVALEALVADAAARRPDPPGGCRGGGGGCRDRGPFIADAYADWCKHGIEALQRMRVNDPSGYVRVIAGILPDKLEVDVKHAVTRIERVIVDHRPQRDVTPTLPQEQPKLIEHNNINSLADADS
jgi:hypothetical protein